jgi:hypothetical protein
VPDGASFAGLLLTSFETTDDPAEPLAYGLDLIVVSVSEPPVPRSSPSGSSRGVGAPGLLAPSSQRQPHVPSQVVDLGLGSGVRRRRGRDRDRGEPGE